MGLGVPQGKPLFELGVGAYYWLSLTEHKLVQSGGTSVTSIPAGSLLAYLAEVPDPRGRQGRRHPLAAMLAATVCAMLCGARGYTAIVQWLHLQPVDTWHLLGFTRIPPKKTCFEKLFAALPAESLERALSQWIEDGLNLSLEEELQAVAIDGKILCGTLTPHQKAVHLLAALDQKTGCVLSQRPVDVKTNEHKEALRLLNSMVVKGRVITGDAMFCQREVCEHILRDDGHYFFVVKENQPTLLRNIASAFAETKAFCPLDAAAV